MKVIGYVALHYGVSYLGYAIRSIIQDVDELWILYTAQGSHGHRTSIPCPETRDELLSIAQQAAGDKLRWVDGNWTHEGQQRDSIHQYVPDADVVVVLDSDEIWTHGLLPRVISAFKFSQVRNIRIPFVHAWRSFYRGFPNDPAYPVRVIFPKKADGTATYVRPAWSSPDENYIFHLGYAQPVEIVQYKLLTHGHRAEFRRDCDWFNDVFLANRQYDCHPVGSEWWDCQDITPPPILQDHPFYGMKVIE